jgi:hypothetical protein
MLREFTDSQMSVRPDIAYYGKKLAYTTYIVSINPLSALR